MGFSALDSTSGQSGEKRKVHKRGSHDKVNGANHDFALEVLIQSTLATFYLYIYPDILCKWLVQVQEIHSYLV